MLSSIAIPAFTSRKKGQGETGEGRGREIRVACVAILHYTLYCTTRACPRENGDAYSYLVGVGGITEYRIRSSVVARNSGGWYCVARRGRDSTGTRQPETNFSVPSIVDLASLDTVLAAGTSSAQENLPVVASPLINPPRIAARILCARRVSDIHVKLDSEAIRSRDDSAQSSIRD